MQTCNQVRGYQRRKPSSPLSLSRRRLRQLPRMLRAASSRSQILGLLPQAMPIAITAMAPADAISAALAIMTNSGYSNLVVLMNPLKWHELRTERVDGGAGVYLVGSWLQPAPPSMWQ